MDSEHRRHDRLLIARYAADDSYPAELDEARAQVAACADCAALAEDIRVLSRAVANVPVPARTRDFRITAEQADKLRGSWFERLMRRLAGPGLGTLRPVAGVALSIGLVMAVAGALPSFTPAGSSSDAEIGFPAPSAAGPAAALEESADPRGGVNVPVDETAVPPGGSAGEPGDFGPITTSATDGPGRGLAEGSGTLEPITQQFDNAHNASPMDGSQRQAGSDEDATAGTPSSMLTYAGLLIAVASLGLLIAAWLARRRFADRLLR